MAPGSLADAHPDAVLHDTPPVGQAENGHWLDKFKPKRAKLDDWQGALVRPASYPFAQKSTLFFNLRPPCAASLRLPSHASKARSHSSRCVREVPVVFGRGSNSDKSEAAEPIRLAAMSARAQRAALEQAARVPQPRSPSVPAAKMTASVIGTDLTIVGERSRSFPSTSCRSTATFAPTSTAAPSSSARKGR